MVSKITDAARGIANTLALRNFGNGRSHVLNDATTKALLSYSDINVQVKDSVIRLAHASQELLNVYSALTKSVAILFPDDTAKTLQRFQQTTDGQLSALNKLTCQLFSAVEKSADGILQTLEELAVKYKEAEAAAITETQHAKRLKQLRQRRMQLATTQTTISRIAQEEQLLEKAIRHRKKLEASLRCDVTQQLARRPSEVSNHLVLTATALARYFHDGHQLFSDIELQWKTLQAWNAQAAPTTAISTYSPVVSPSAKKHQRPPHPVRAQAWNAFSHIVAPPTSIRPLDPASAAEHQVKEIRAAPPPSFPSLERAKSCDGTRVDLKVLVTPSGTSPAGSAAPTFPGEESALNNGERGCPLPNANQESGIPKTIPKSVHQTATFGKLTEVPSISKSPDDQPAGKTKLLPNVVSQRQLPAETLHSIEVAASHKSHSITTADPNVAQATAPNCRKRPPQEKRADLPCDREIVKQPPSVSSVQERERGRFWENFPDHPSSGNCADNCSVLKR